MPQDLDDDAKDLLTREWVRFLPQEEGRVAVVLRETNFYAQGGGQPSDVGKMEGGGSTFEVADVRIKGVRRYVSFRLSTESLVPAALQQVWRRQRPSNC
eukprot:1196239-Prorocentrum_minimum.AAC.2